MILLIGGEIDLGIRITGVSIAFGGLSWEITENDKRGIEKLFYFLETKRLLINPIEMELPEQCAASAIEIKNYIATLLGQYQFSNAPKVVLKSMGDACNMFLDELNSERRPHIIYKNDHGDWCDNNFSHIMKKFRSVFRSGIQELERHFDVEFGKIIPEDY
jgi:hypothetical protein